MTDLYMDQPGSKKKYLIPLVVLLLCAVSLTGAGFAYSSTVTDSGNTTAEGDAVLLNLYKDSNCANVCDGSAFAGEFQMEITSTTTNGTTVWTVDTEDTTVTKYLKATGNLKDVNEITVVAKVMGLEKFTYQLKVGEDVVATDGQTGFAFTYNEATAVTLTITGLVTESFDPVSFQKITAAYTVSFTTTDQTSDDSDDGE